MSVVFHAREKWGAQKGVCRALDYDGEIAPDIVEEGFKSLSGFCKSRRQDLKLIGTLKGQAEQFSAAIIRIVNTLNDTEPDQDIHALGGDLMRLAKCPGNVCGRGRLVLPDVQDSRDCARGECDPGRVQHVISLRHDQFGQSLKLVRDERGTQPVFIDKIFVAHLLDAYLHN
ncbi:MAG: hypothetical protein V7675_16575 [Hyphomonas sp.]